MSGKIDTNVFGNYVRVSGGGAGRRRVFATDTAKREFVGRLARALDQSSIRCIGWMLARDRYELLFVTHNEAVTSVMRPLLRGFAASFNRRRRRTGSVFTGTYRVVDCGSAANALEQLRNMHLSVLTDPAAASMADLDCYRWSGHAPLVGTYAAPWQDTDHVLGLFSPFAVLGRAKYRAFMADGLALRRCVGHAADAVAHGRS